MAYLEAIDTSIETDTDVYYRAVEHIQPILAELVPNYAITHAHHENTFAAYIGPQFDQLKKHCILYRIGQTDERVLFAKALGEWSCLNALEPEESISFLCTYGSDELGEAKPIVQSFASGLIAVRNNGLSIDETLRQLSQRDLTQANRDALNEAASYLQ